MDLGVQSLNPAVHHFWKAGVLRDFYRGNALLREQLIGAPGGEYLDVKLLRAFAKGTMPVLSETLINARRMAADFSVVIGLSLLVGVVGVDAKPGI